jgi:hypothetical protein
VAADEEDELEDEVETDVELEDVAEQILKVPPFNPSHIQNHVPLELPTAEAVPALHRPELGFVVVEEPLAEPHAPLTTTTEVVLLEEVVFELLLEDEALEAALLEELS